MPPEVSVVIPTYNRQDTILRAVHSVLGQTHRDLELIVVDDASTDGTAALLQAIDDPRIRQYRHTENRGAAAARNTGIGAATGGCIAFLDSDDAWLPQKLELQIAALRAAPPNQAVSCHGVTMHLIDHRTRREQPLEASADWKLRLALGCDLSPGATQLARREVFARIGPLDETLPRFEDWDWLLRYTQAGGGILALREPLAHVWNRRSRLGVQYELSTRLFTAKHAAIYAALPPQLRRQALCDIWLQVSGTYAFEGRAGDAVRTALRGARHRPLHTVLRVARHLLGHGAILAGAGREAAPA